jgi:hypothetical protein
MNYIGSSKTPSKKITTLRLMEMKKAGQKIVALTGYDAMIARILDESGVDPSIFFKIQPTMSFSCPTDRNLSAGTIARANRKRNLPGCDRASRID